MDIEKNKDLYMHIHADCIPVKGVLKSAIYDLTRSELILFSTDYYEVLEYLISDKIGNLFKSITCEEEKNHVLNFINFLEENEVVLFVENPAMFPPIQELWDMPAIITNAIIDVNKIRPDFDKIFIELDELGCQFIQIRSFSNLLQIKDIYHLLSKAKHKSIKSVELLLKYNAEIKVEEYIQLVEAEPILSSLVIHSSPLDKKESATFGASKDLSYPIDKEILFTSQCIDSNSHCGIITIKHLNAPAIDNFFETKLYNGCLNRKISIDENGEIKNCPSMATSYGNIKSNNLKSVLAIPEFKQLGNITKDQINICKDCEYRYACSDCRAYVETPEDIYSKPLKCGYDPYTATWQDWSTNANKEKAIKYYELAETFSSIVS
jgi:SPASM domain peptide maturase of grasp-with-spasm system